MYSRHDTELKSKTYQNSQQFSVYSEGGTDPGKKKRKTF